MTLEELVSRLAETDDGLTVFAAEPWTARSDATAVPNPGGSSRPDAEGRTYLLEVVLIRDVLETWRAHRGGAVPSPREACAAVIHYAEHDAYQHPDEEPPLSP
ncbi:hypothetical protein [Streptomyces sp. NPDC087859]|uniref:hypothetical protein n=1 Tax=Streptomyces sp. NPDC087859 TaxID=3365812 RepID=UPI00380954FE